MKRIIGHLMGVTIFLLFSVDINKNGLRAFFTWRKENPVCLICNNDFVEHDSLCWVGKIIMWLEEKWQYD